MAATEFTCLVSDQCLLKKQCFSAEQFKKRAGNIYHLSRIQAQDNIGKGLGPFATQNRWNYHRRKARQAALAQNCAQPDFFDQELDQLTREKKQRGELA